MGVARAVEGVVESGGVDRRTWLALFLGGLASACAGQNGSARPPAPVTLPPGRQIPVDLDVVIRLDVERLRGKLNSAAAEALARLLISPAESPGQVVMEALTHTKRLWIGVRPDLRPQRWDNVLILEGDFADVSTEALVETFGPSLDLGGGYRRYDRLGAGTRVSPARLYTLHEERFIFASEAEIDALERVIEQGRAEREETPPARGLSSVTARLTRLPELSEAKAPLRALQRAESFDGSLDLLDGKMKVSSSVLFVEESDALLAQRALNLLASVALPRDIEMSAEASGPRLAVEASLPVRYLLSAIGS